MTKAVLFDLDGTLIQTELLKARSYAQALHQLTQSTVTEKEGIDAFKDYVGLSRKEVVAGLATRFHKELAEHMKTDDSSVLQDKLINKRLEVYHAMLEDSKLLSGYFCPFNLALFHKVKQAGLQVVLATMSHRKEADRILKLMGIQDKFDLIRTRDDVKQGKPDPEIYIRAYQDLRLAPGECLVIEDSINGIKAALHAKTPVFAVTNDITRKSVHNSGLLDADFIIDNLSELVSKVFSFLALKDNENVN